MQWLSRLWAWLLARSLKQLLLLNGATILLFTLAQWIAPHPGAIQLQTCFYASSFRQILDRWSSSGVWAFGISLVVLDSVFPFLYAAGLRRLYERWCTLLGFQPLESVRSLPVVAAGCDLTENAFLLLSLVAWSRNAAALDVFVPLVATAGLLKWALLFVVALALVVALFQSRWGWAVSTCRFGWISVLVGGLPLILSSQGQDLLRILVDDATGRLQWWLAAFVLVGWAVSVWYWCRVLLMVRWEKDRDDADPMARLIVKWLPRALGTAAILMVTIGFVRTPGATPVQGTALAWHAAGSAALALAFLYAVSRRRVWLKALGLPAVPPRVDSWRDLPRGSQRIAGLSVALSLVVLALVTWWSVPVGRWLGAVAVVFGFAAHLAFAGSVVLFLERVWSLRLVALALVCAAFFSQFNDNHALRLVPGGDQKLRPPLAKAFDAWAADRLSRWPEGRPMPVFLVAAEGGGIRAAYWTAAALGRLADSHAGFAEHLFAISGVSGGSVGAATFVSLLRDREHTSGCAAYAQRAGHDGASLGPIELCAQEILRQDHLAPVLSKMLAPDLAQWFVPFPVPAFDRARALEDSFSDAYRRVVASGSQGAATFEASFSSAWPKCATPDCTPAPVFTLPALLLNGTRVKDGQRVLHAPVTWTEHELPEVADLATLLGEDVSLSTAAHDSARFAYVSPAGRLLSKDGTDQGHVVDGGYFENSGAATLMDVLNVLRGSRSRDRLQFEVVYLCNSAERCWDPGAQAQPSQPRRRRFDATEVFAPVQALLGAREARGELALAAISRTPDLAGFLELGTCPGDPTQAAAPEPLGWQLSEVMRSRLNEQTAGHGAPGNAMASSCIAALLEGTAVPAVCGQRIARSVACIP
jgi:hypothetical protein